jgi:hypothetical protein
MWRKRNRRRRERAAGGPRSVFPLGPAVEEDLRSPEAAFSDLELDFFRRAEELYVFEGAGEWEVDQP